MTDPMSLCLKCKDRQLDRDAVLADVVDGAEDEQFLIMQRRLCEACDTRPVAACVKEKDGAVYWCKKCATSELFTAFPRAIV